MLTHIIVDKHIAHFTHIQAHVIMIGCCTGHSTVSLLGEKEMMSHREI